MEIPQATSLKYLGSTIRGRLDSEVSRKFGLVKPDFLSLPKLGGHADIPVSDKLCYFEGLVIAHNQQNNETS